jgi:hypothetical protein
VCKKKAVFGGVRRKTPKVEVLMARMNDDEDDGDIIARTQYRRRRLVDDEDDDEVLDPEIELLQLLYWQDSYQASLQRNRSRVDSLLRRYPDLLQRWQQFLRNGGVGAEHWEQYLNGRMRPRLTRQRKHLRLISRKAASPVKLKTSSNDAA